MGYSSKGHKESDTTKQEEDGKQFTINIAVIICLKFWHPFFSDRSYTFSFLLVNIIPE